MPVYRARVDWALKDGEDFARGRYSRGHTIGFDEGVTVPGTASHHVIPRQFTVDAAVDPEEMLTAALSTCHMLTFLHKAREAGLIVTAYSDAAEGVMEKTPDGRMAVTRVILRPAITYAGAAPDAEARARLHHASHEECFIANSVKTEVTVEEREPAVA
jgi:organic hydroperoxide reductase OsmC/OhrA